MTIDRRSEERAGPERRIDHRALVYEPIQWRPAAETRLRRGVLIGISPSGLAILTERLETPRVHTQILVPRMPNRQRCHRTMVVKRTQPLSESFDLVAMEYDNEPNDPGAPLGVER